MCFTLIPGGMTADKVVVCISAAYSLQRVVKPAQLQAVKYCSREKQAGIRRVLSTFDPAVAQGKLERALI